MKRFTLMMTLACGALLTVWCNAFAQWVQTDGPAGGYLSTILMQDSATFYVAGLSQIFFTTNSGTDMKNMSNGIHADDYILSLARLGHTLIAGTWSHGAYRSTDDGASWQGANNGLDSTSQVTPVIAMGSKFFCGWDFSCYVSADSGASWVAASNGLPKRNIVSFSTAGGNLYAAIKYSGVFVSSDSGASWTSISAGLPSNYYLNTVFANDTLLLVGTQDRGAFLSRDIGASWTQINYGLADLDVRTFFIDETDIIVGTGQGYIYHSPNLGTNWLPCLKSPDRPNSINAITGVSSNNLWAATASGLYRSSGPPTSLTWTMANSGPISNSAVPSIVQIDSNIFAANYGAGVGACTMKNPRWLPKLSGLKNLWAEDLAVKGDVLFLATDSGGVYRAKPYTSDWQATGTDLNSPIVYCLAVYGSTVYAGTKNGLSATTDDGATWQNLNAGDLDNMAVVAIVADGSNLFLGTYDGLYVSSNNGMSWLSSTTLPQHTPVLSLLISDHALYALVQYQGIWSSQDDGQSWTQISNNLPAQSPVVAFTARGRDIICASVQDVYLLRENGSQWEKITEGLDAGRGVQSLSVLQDAGLAYLWAGTDGMGAWRRPLSDVLEVQNSDHGIVSSAVTLEQNFPNPFNKSTRIRYSLAREENATIMISDLLGRVVKDISCGNQSPGNHEIAWDGADTEGKRVASGMYLISIQSGGELRNRVLNILR